MYDQARAILRAQWLSVWNFYPRRNLPRLLLTIGLTAVWYGSWTTGAVLAGILLANPDELPLLERVVPTGLMVMFFYWQFVPILMVSTGASLDLTRLMVYPIPHGQLFGLEVLLRLTTGLEMVVVLAGATAGLLLNPAIPLWAPAGFLPLVIMNLCLAVGLRDLLGRLLARKYVREASVLVLVLAAAVPQLLPIFGVPEPVRRFVTAPPNPIWPWNAAGKIALGAAAVTPWLTLAAWLVAAYAFGRWQFERSLRFDTAAAQSARPASRRADRWIDMLYRLPSMPWNDPLAAVVEKEIRFLSRAPRVRLVFVMGFSFGMLIWLPLALRGVRGEESTFAANYLIFVSVYALLLLGEVTYWNSFGFDRAAAQLYFLAPVRTSTILVGKNIAAVVFVFLEVTAVVLVCFLVRMPVSAFKLAECYAVSLVLTVYLLAAGNLGSTHFPRPVNPAQSWRSSSGGRFQALLLLVYPVVSIPVILAYLARYAFESNAAFFGVLAFAAALGGVIYWIALDSAVETIEQRQEKLLETLAQGEGPVSA